MYKDILVENSIF